MKTTATVRVRVVVGVSVSSAWSDDCTVAQVRKQGSEAAVAAVHRALDCGAAKGVQVLGVEALEMVVTSEAER